MGPVDDDLVGQREAGLGGEHLAGVAHGDVEAEHLGHPHQGGGEVDGAEDEQPRRRGVGLEEDGDGLLVGLAAGAVAAHRRGAGGQRGLGVAVHDAVQVGVGELAGGRLALDEQQLVADARPVDDGDEHRRPVVADGRLRARPSSRAAR